MSRFISHAQNFEDVLLWRALKHLQPGWYVDIGAQDPVVDSVSLAFYERGWRGVHVEPVPDYAKALREQREGDHVVEAAVGTSIGMVELHAFANTGLSTLDEVIAHRHQSNGYLARTIRVPSVTLDEILGKASGDIHWLKIDVEGAEHDVISSWRNDELRPWLVVVESTMPLDTVASHHAWEPKLLSKGYRFALFDGLNRFYVSPDHPELLDAFQSAANVFDDFALSGDASAPFCEQVNRRVHELRKELDKSVDEAANRVAYLEKTVREQRSDFDQQLSKLSTARRTIEIELLTQTRVAAAADAQAKALRLELDAVYASASWRMTSVVRGVRRALSAGSLRAPVIGIARPMLTRAMRYALARPGVKRHVMSVLSRHPSLLVRLQRFAVRAGMAADMGAFEASRGRQLHAHIAHGMSSLKAGRILQDLQRVTREKQD